MSASQIKLMPRQDELLQRIVTAYKKTDPPQKFMVLRTDQRDILRHPNLTEDVFMGDIEALSDAGMLRAETLPSRTVNFDVTTQALDYCNPPPSGLTGGEIARIVYAYIGVNGGVLGDFSYRSLDEFLAVNCELEIGLERSRTNREYFIDVLRSSTPDIQVRILRALLEKFPAPTATGSTVMSVDDVRTLISRLEGLPVPESSPANASQVVRNALADAETLLKTHGAPRAVDRVHTALHGYLRNLCDQAGIVYAEEDSVQRLLKVLTKEHPTLQREKDVAEFIAGILGPVGTAIDRINDARNTKSLAHPNEDLLSEPEAMLVINVVRTLFHYLEAKLS